VRDFKELKVWQRSHRLTLAVYNATGTFPREETYGLSAQDYQQLSQQTREVKRMISTL
jgi:23S rRNA-intervening sequence protein